MNAGEKCLLSSFERIAVLKEGHEVYLVQHQESRNIFVEKRLSVYNLAVYRYLKEHPVKGLPAILELIEDGDSLIVIEEYISGRTIRSLLDDGNLFSEEDAVSVIEKLCGTLTELHHAQPPIVHRDIKPSNLILTGDGDVYLVDMNAAKQLLGAKNEDTALIGTVGYAAPEQYGFGQSDVRADLYAIGILLNEMILGVPPKERTVPGNLGTVIRNCTMLDPQDRYSSVEELLHALGKKAAPYGSRQQSMARKSLCIPGFRSRNPAHMAAAIMGYGFAAVVSLSLKTQSADGNAMLWIERIYSVVLFLGLILLTFNYRDVWSRLRIDRFRSPWAKTAAVLAADLVLAILLTITMALCSMLL